MPQVPIWIRLLIITWTAIHYDVYGGHSGISEIVFKHWQGQRICGKQFVNQEVELDDWCFDE